MSNLYTFLAGFDPYKDDDEPLVWGDDEVETLKLDAEQRRDFDATVAAIADARRIQRQDAAAWEAVRRDIERSIYEREDAKDRIEAECEQAWREHEAAGDGD